jgi:phage terminase large subunit
MQFYLRLQGQIYLTFNPIDANHWIKKELIDSGNYDVFEDVSTYKDNPFLSEARRKRIENLINIDENFYKIYNLGQWGILKNIIYENWKTFRKISDYDKKPQEISYGIDWGYESPCSLVKIYWFDGEKVIWEELIYQEHLLIPDFIKLAKERIAEEEKDTDKQTAYLQKELRKEFYAGTDEPDSIQQFHNAGFNIHKANTDVRDGINFCKAHLIGLIGANIIKEAQGYKRKEDKNGNVLEEPVKFMDHSMDAGRYGTYSRIKGKPATAKTSTISFR